MFSEQEVPDKDLFIQEKLKSKRKVPGILSVMNSSILLLLLIIDTSRADQGTNIIKTARGSNNATERTNIRETGMLSHLSLFLHS